MTSEPALAVAVEGGGTKTVALAVNREGEVVAWGRGGSSLVLHVGERRASAALAEALDAVVARVEADQIEAAAVSLVGRGYSADPAEPLRSRFPHACVRHVHEGDAALLGATLERAGVVVVSGTGSFARAVGKRGAVGHVGGNGPLVGDEGSGHYIAVEGIRRALWSVDGRSEPTELSGRLCDRYQLSELKDICRYLYGPRALSRHALASVAPLVVAAAGDGDAVAADVLSRAAGHLAAMALAGVSRVREAGDGWSGPVPLGCSGGVLLGAPALRVMVVEQVTAVEPDLTPVGPFLPPVGGVALAALSDADVSVDSEVATRLARALPAEVSGQGSS